MVERIHSSAASSVDPPPARSGRGQQDSLRDFTADWRLMALAGMATVLGTAGAAAAWVLLHLINLARRPAAAQELSGDRRSGEVGGNGIAYGCLPLDD
jgi:hypothetical protein